MELTEKQKRKQEYNRQYRAKNREAILKQSRQARYEIRLAALVYYSLGDIPECTCCGETEIKFLGIDHIDGGGTKHRKATKSKYMMHWLKIQGYPDGFQTLCHNCNMAKGFYGVCPHKEKLVKGEANENV